MEQMTDEHYKSLVEAGSEIPASPQALPLQIKHSENDVLEGCPRTLSISGVPIKQKAFKGRRYEEFIFLIANYAFETCETPEDLDKITIDDIFANMCLGITCLQASIDDNKPRPLEGLSFNGYLYTLMEAEGSIALDPDEITNEEYKAFFAILLEQNNVLKTCKVLKKKHLKALLLNP